MFPDDQHGSPAFILLTCEHGGRDVPEAYKPLFHGRKAILDSHRGYDVGALGVALRLASRLSVPIVFSTTTRLLIDLNRSLDQPDTYSEFTSELSSDERSRIESTFYQPYRTSVATTIASAITAGRRVLHLGVHSCTDVLHGEQRELDISLLFDESRVREERFALRYRNALTRFAGDLRYPFNTPYKGADDGLTSTLRGQFPEESYLGIEIEVRQGMILRPAEQRAAGDLLATALQSIPGSSIT